MKTGEVVFYPSHLTKGLVGMTLSWGFAIYACREFSKIGTDVYPEPEPLFKQVKA